MRNLKQECSGEKLQKEKWEVYRLQRGTDKHWRIIRKRIRKWKNSREEDKNIAEGEGKEDVSWILERMVNLEESNIFFFCSRRA